MPLRFERGERPGRANHRGDVDIVAASVHYADILAGRVLCGDVTGVGKAGFFDHRQRVEIRADENPGSRAVFEDADDAIGLRAVRIFADAFGNGVAGFAELGGEQGRSVLFLMRQFGMRVEALVGCHQISDLGIDSRGESLWM